MRSSTRLVVLISLLLLPACTSLAESRISLPGWSVALAVDGSSGLAALNHSSDTVPPECVVWVLLPNGTTGAASNSEFDVAAPSVGGRSQLSRLVASLGQPKPLVELVMLYDSAEPTTTPSQRTLTINGETRKLGLGTLILVDARGETLEVLHVAAIDLSSVADSEERFHDRVTLLKSIVAKHPGTEKWR